MSVSCGSTRSALGRPMRSGRATRFAAGVICALAAFATQQGVALANPTPMGVMDCRLLVNCNTSTSTYGADANGLPLTLWSLGQQDWGLTPSNCPNDANPNGGLIYRPWWVVNQSNKLKVGVYIDDSADSSKAAMAQKHTEYYYRQQVADCVWRQASELPGFATESEPFKNAWTNGDRATPNNQWVILVTFAKKERGHTIEVQSGGFPVMDTGDMLEVYPYCTTKGGSTSQSFDFKESSLTPANIVPQQGYMSQNDFLGFGKNCAVPPSAVSVSSTSSTTLAQAEWSYLWGEINGTYTTFGHYYDLLAKF